MRCTPCLNEIYLPDSLDKLQYNAAQHAACNTLRLVQTKAKKRLEVGFQYLSSRLSIETRISKESGLYLEN